MAFNAFIKEAPLIFIGLLKLLDAQALPKSKRGLTAGKTLAMSWLPVTESAKSTIMARRALNRSEVSLVKKIQNLSFFLPFSRFAHASYHFIQSLSASLFEGLGHGLASLLVGRKFKEALQNMVQCHALMPVGPVFQN